MKTKFLYTLASILMYAFLMPAGAADSITARRETAEKKAQKGNWKDALADFEELLKTPENTGPELAQDLQRANDCLQNLGQQPKFDALMDTAITAHPKHWQLLQKAAVLYANAVPFGTIISGEFQRGSYAEGGKQVGSGDRDRVRSLQLYTQAMEAASAADAKTTPAERGELLLAFAASLQAVEGWELQALTDLTKLPDYEEGGYGYYGRRGRGYYGGTTGRGAPVDEKGEPVYHKIPGSFAEAACDGERWRWLLAESAKIGDDWKPRTDLIFAGFLNEQFGEHTLADWAVWPRNDDDAEAKQDSILTVHTLKENETVARLASGPKRFTLPEEFDYIAIYKRISEAKSDDDYSMQATSALVQVFMNRRQHVRAAEILRKAVDFHPSQAVGWKEQLHQIVDAFGELEPTMQKAAGQGAKLGYLFRNGTKVSFVARKVDFEKLLTDVKAYLKSDPESLDWNRAQLHQLGYRIFDEGHQKYLGAEVAKWDLELKPRDGHWDRRIEIATPLQAAGAYLVEAAMANGNVSKVLVWLTDTVIVRKQGAGEVQFYVTDAETGAPVAKANLDIFGHKYEYLEPKKQKGKRQYHVLTTNFAEFTDEQGQFFANNKNLVSSEYDWMITARTKEGRFAHLGVGNVWYPEKQHEDFSRTKVYAITDRPVYRPAQKVKFKAWVRIAKYDQPEDKSAYADVDFNVAIHNPKGEAVYEKVLKADGFGGVDGELDLPEEATLGTYGISITSKDGNVGGGGNFRVEEYKKPEFEVIVDSPKEPVMLGEKVGAKITAKYYFGAPVQDAKVTYKIMRSSHDARWYPMRPWDWFYGPGYWWFCYDCEWLPGWQQWGCKAPRWWWYPWSVDPPELVLEHEGKIGADGTLQIEIDTSVAKDLHPDEDHKYEITVEVTDQSRRTIVGTGRVLVARKPFSVFVWNDRGHYNVGDPILTGISARTLDDKGVVGTGKLSLLKLTYNEKGEVQEEEVSSQEIKTDEDGGADVKLSATAAGQYRLSAKIKDAKDHEIEGGYVFVVRGEGFDGRDFRFNQIELVADKPEYAPGEEVKLLINTERPNSTVYLFVRSVNGISTRPKILHIKGKVAQEVIKIEQNDMPNFFIEAFTVSDGKVHSAQRELAVPPAKLVLNMEVLADAEKYKPRGTAKLKVKLTDLEGKPYVGSTVLTVYDKALEYISGGSNIPEIREFFWKWRRQNYAQIQSSLDQTFFVQTNPPMHRLGVFGYMTGDMDEIMEKGEGRSAGGFKDGRANRDLSVGMAMPMSAPAPMAEAANGAPAADALESKMEGAATPGEDGAPAQNVMVRSNFADSVYWTASVMTNAEGIAEIEVPLPDNLTTWKIRSWGMGHGTKVGSAEAEVITSKDLILRQQAPRFFTEKDEVILSANVHNYHPDKKTVQVSLEFEGTCLELIAGQEATQGVAIDSNGETRVDWRVKAMREGTAVVRMKAVTDGDADAMQMSYPVLVHGMLKTESWSAVVRPDGDRATLKMKVPNERRPEQTSLEVRYSPSLATAMVDALPYLIDYPYGCTEQTLNRFVPVVVTHKILVDMGLDLKAIKEKRTNLNAQEIGIDKERAEQWKKYQGLSNGIFDDDEYRRLVRHSLEKITSMQNGDGGWGWFSGERELSYPHTTATVIHGLITARNYDLALLPNVVERGIAWLKAYEEGEVQKIKNGMQDKKVDPWKDKADNLDAFVHMVLTDGDVVNKEMRDFLFRDKNDLSVYAKCLIGLAYDTQKQVEKRDEVVENIEQFLVKDDENQSARLDLRNGAYWWYWYGSEFEAHAYYLKLLSRVKPKSEQASGLAKFLLNNRKNAYYWTSTRDTALCVEAMADYINATGENMPDMTVEVVLDGAVKKEVKITKENLFSYDNVFMISGEALAAGDHTVEIRRKGKGAVYANAYLTNFTLEDRITKAGLEVKVDRKYYKLTERKDAKTLVSGSRGQAIDQKVLKYDRTEIKDGEDLKSGDLIEVELTIESKNDYEYLMFEDMKAAGFEPVDIRSGYTYEGLGAYQEFRDERVAFFVRALPLGKHNLSYRLRAEIPGKFSALPAKALGMYAPELRANSDEMKVGVTD